MECRARRVRVEAAVNDMAKFESEAPVTCYWCECDYLVFFMTVSRSYIVSKSGSERRRNVAYAAQKHA